ncbi:unnamed protein product [Miscanthus lutarioriparius]|uniref:R13L1/DRL21-like LRR repeat region domain-containing protein n=1 Tax=Miscanthus lutarioriparius TaxID=422564 RepID=A0A811S3W5_9POAL|nr:unnamed protein product [Miscanthus lutarioriparius]
MTPGSVAFCSRAVPRSLPPQLPLPCAMAMQRRFRAAARLRGSEAEKINLVGKEELQLLSLEWSSKCDMIDNVALENLQPHQNLGRLCIKNYPIGAGFPHWMQSLPNLVSMELSHVQAGHLHLDHLQNLEDLHVSPFSSSEERIRYASPRSMLRISSTRPLKKLKRVTMAWVGKLVWESSCLPSENLFPGLEYLEIYCCRDVKFEPSIPRSARYIISGRRLHEWSFRCPSFKQVMGLSTSASSKLEIKYIIGQLSCESFDSLRQLDCEELTVDTCSNPVPLPECIQDWKSLRRY